MIMQYTFHHDKKQARALGSCHPPALDDDKIQVSKLTRSIKETQARVEEQEEELEAERFLQNK